MVIKQTCAIKTKMCRLNTTFLKKVIEFATPDLNVMEWPGTCPFMLGALPRSP